MLSVALSDDEAKKRGRLFTSPPFFIDCQGIPSISILVCISAYFGLFLMGNNPLTNDFQRSREGRNGSCVHSPALPGDVARGAAAVCVSPEDDPPGTARSPMGGGG